MPRMLTLLEAESAALTELHFLDLPGGWSPEAVSTEVIIFCSSVS